MLSAGIDFHKRYSVVHVLDDAGATVKKGRVEPNSAGGFAGCFAEFAPGSVRAVFEASMNWCYLYDLLHEIGAVADVTLANPYKPEFQDSLREALAVVTRISAGYGLESRDERERLAAHLTMVGLGRRGVIVYHEWKRSRMAVRRPASWPRQSGSRLPQSKVAPPRLRVSGRGFQAGTRSFPGLRPKEGHVQPADHNA